MPRRELPNGWGVIGGDPNSSNTPPGSSGIGREPTARSGNIRAMLPQERVAWTRFMSRIWGLTPGSEEFDTAVGQAWQMALQNSWSATLGELRNYLIRTVGHPRAVSTIRSLSAMSSESTSSLAGGSVSDGQIVVLRVTNEYEGALLEPDFTGLISLTPLVGFPKVLVGYDAQSGVVANPEDGFREIFYRVNPNTPGDLNQLQSAGSWAGNLAGAYMNGRLQSSELYRRAKREEGTILFGRIRLLVQTTSGVVQLITQLNKLAQELVNVDARYGGEPVYERIRQEVPVHHPTSANFFPRDHILQIYTHLLPPTFLTPVLSVDNVLRHLDMLMQQD